MNGVIYCSSCGTQNPQDAKFCCACGKPIAFAKPAAAAPVVEEKPAPVVEETAAPVVEETAAPAAEEATPAKAEPAPATEQQETPQSAPAPAAPAKANSKSNYAKIAKIARSGLIVLFAALFLLFSFFSVGELNVDYDSDTTLTISYNVIDNTKVFVNSLYSQEHNEIYDSSLYEKTYDMGQELNELESERGSEKPSGKELRLAEKIFKNHILLSVRSENVKPQFTALFAAGFGIAFVIVCLVLLIGAIKNFIDTFSGKEGGAKAPLGGLCAVIPLSVASFFFTKMSVTQFVGMEYDVKMTALVKWIIALAIIAILTYMIPNLIKNRKAIKLWASRALVLVFAVLMVCALCFPILSAAVKETYQGGLSEKEAKSPIKADYYTYLNLANEDSYFYTSTSSYRNYSRTQIAKGENSRVTYSIATGSLVKTSNLLLNFKYACFVVFIMVLLLVCLLQRALFDLVSAESTSTVALNILSLVAAILLLVISIAIIILTNLSSPSNFKLGVGSSYIAMIVFSILGFVAYAVRNIGGSESTTKY